MHHERWLSRAAKRCLNATSSVGGGCRAPPPPFSVRWQEPDTVCVGRTPTSVRSKKYMEKVCNGFLISKCWFVLVCVGVCVGVCFCVGVCVVRSAV